MHNTPDLDKNEKNFRLRAVAVALALAAILSSGAEQALANNSSGGGYFGPGPDFVTVKQAKTMNDDDHVALKGYIVQRIGSDKYLFRDDTGDIILDISDRRWEGQQISPADLVEIYGEVDKDCFDRKIEIQIEVKQIAKP